MPNNRPQSPSLDQQLRWKRELEISQMLEQQRSPGFFPGPGAAANAALSNEYEGQGEEEEYSLSNNAAANDSMERQKQQVAMAARLGHGPANDNGQAAGPVDDFTGQPSDGGDAAPPGGNVPEEESESKSGGSGMAKAASRDDGKPSGGDKGGGDDKKGGGGGNAEEENKKRVKEQADREAKEDADKKENSLEGRAAAAAQSVLTGQATVGEAATQAAALGIKKTVDTYVVPVVPDVIDGTGFVALTILQIYWILSVQNVRGTVKLKMWEHAYIGFWTLIEFAIIIAVLTLISVIVCALTPSCAKDMAFQFGTGILSEFGIL